MKLAVLPLNDPWSQRVTRDASATSDMLRGVATDVYVNLDAVEFLHHGPEQRYRPYLHLQGEIVQLAPQDALPYGITDLHYKPGAGPRLDAFYEFTDGQLADLVTKGYFTEDFTVPEEMINAQLDVPGVVDYLVVYPEYADEVPVIFAGVRDRNDLVLNAENSGYDLDVYFQSVQRSDVEVTRELTEAQREGARVYEGEIDDLFAGESLDEYRQAYEQDQRTMVAPSVEHQGQETVPASAFDRLVAEAEERYAAFEEERAEAEAAEGDSIRHLYESQIAPQVESALAGGQSPETDDVQEAEASSKTTADDSQSSRRRAEQRRREDIDDLFADDDPESHRSQSPAQDEPEF